MRRTILRRLCIAAVLAAPLYGVAAQQPVRKIALADYLDWEDVQSPQLSPDGRQVIYTRRWVDKLNDKWESSLWIMSSDGSRNRLLVNGQDARWSPDGNRVAYLAKGEPSGTQLWVRYMDAEGATTQITRVTEAPSNPEWNPDGRTIAFQMLVPQKESWQIPMPAAPKGAKWTEPPRIIQNLVYRADRTGFLEEGFRHLFVVPADGGTPRQLTSGNFNHGPGRWMPDGASLVFAGLREPDAQWMWRESEIYRVDAASGDVRQLTRRKGPDQGPVPSPDGQFIAYTGFDSTSDTWVDSKLYVMNADGSNSRVISTGFARSPQRLEWSYDGSAVYFSAESEGAVNLYVASLKGGVKEVTRGAQVLTIGSIGKLGNVVAVRADATHPNDVVAFDIKKPAELHQLTNVNDDVLAGKTLGRMEEIWVTSKDGLRVQGWVVKPPDFDPSKKYPLVLDIHGGPHAMYNVGFSFVRQENAAAGFIVLYTNPRGSTGYGSAFGNAIKFDYPGKDFDDLMASVDTVVGRGNVDPKNMFVTGCSGGGVLTAWIVGHTDRFTAAASRCPVIDWISFVGTTDGASWYYNFEKLPWDDPREHLRRSPLMYVGRVKTPTLLMTGVLDLRTPISQTEEFYSALKLRKVPTAMIRFNEEFHGTSSKPSNFLRTELYLRSWWEKHGSYKVPDPKRVNTASDGK